MVGWPLVLLAAMLASAPTPDPTCAREDLLEAETLGRNGWALKCAFIDHVEFLYISFSDGFIAFERPHAPTHDGEDCSRYWGPPVAFCRGRYRIF